MFQNIIKASRLRGLPSSIAIGGAATLITNAATLAQYLTITTASIRNFRIVGDTVLANVINTYEIGATALTFENDTNIRYFNQGIGGISTGFTRYFANSSVFYVTSRTEGRVSSDEMYEDSALKYAFFENGDTLRGYRCFGGLENAKIYLGNLQFLERIAGGANSPFIACANVDVYVPSSAPVIPNQGSDFNRIDILSTTTPDAIDDLNAIHIGGTYIELDFTEIPAADFYEVWQFKNSVWELIGEIEPNGNKYLLGLEENTNYQFRLATCDQYWNGSGFFEDAAKQAISDTINVTTTTTPALFQNAVAYYKLDETSGNAIDVVNGYNGTLFGGVTQGVAGKIGTAYSFDGVDGYIDVNESFDFIQNTLVFTINMWVKINDLNQRASFLGTNGATSSKGFYIIFENGVGAGNQSIRFVAVKGVSGDSVISKISNDNAINDNNYHLISIVGVGNDVKIYVDNVETSYNTTSPFASPFSSLSTGTTTNPMYIGGLHSLGNLSSPFNGIIDEVNINDTDFTTGEINDLYNNGNGTTI